MKFVRLLLTGLTLIVVLAALLAVLAFVPIVQTWVAQAFLAKQPALNGSLGSLMAGFGKVDIEGLHLEFDGAVLTLPSLQASLPLTTAARRRMLVIRSVVAKDWTLDLSHLSEPGPSSAPAAAPPASSGAPGSTAAVAAEPPTPAAVVSAQKVADIVHGILSEWALPCDLSLDGVDLEGTVRLRASPGAAPTRLHVTIQGGGMAAGHDGVFTVNVSDEFVDANFEVNTVAAQGKLVVAMESPRRLSRIGLATNLSAKGGPVPENLDLSADLTAARGAEGETYTLELNRGSRHLANFVAGFPKATRRLAGTWQLDVRDSDLAPFTSGHPLPSLAATGSGRFDANAAFTQVHVLGQLHAVADHAEVLAPSLGRLGAMTIDASFDLNHRGQSSRIDRLSVAIGGNRPIVTMQSLQPLDLDERTGAVRLADPHADGMAISIRGFPLAWLSNPAAGFAFTGNEVNGELVARTTDGGFVLRSKAPLTATGVAVTAAAGTLASHLDLSLSLLADYSSQGWQVQGAPLTVGSAGRRLATLSVKASQAGAEDQPILIAGTGKADLGALASLPSVIGSRWIAGRSASGDFTLSVGGSTVADGKVTVIGRNPDHSVTVSVQSSVDADGGISFLAPVTVAFGSKSSEMSAEGSWASTPTGPQLVVKVSGQDVSLEHLQLLVAPIAMAAHLRPRRNGEAPLFPGGFALEKNDIRDTAPFWGNLTGSLSLAIDRLNTPQRVLKSVGGTLDLDAQSLQLERGRAELPNHSQVKAEGSLTFDPAAALPYRLKGTASIDQVEAAPWFPSSQSGQDSLLEGRFAVAAKATGSGINLADVASRAQEEFRLTSTEGIFRLLKTSVAESIPEVATPVKDTLGTVGSVVGPLFGHSGYSIESGKNPVSKTADAVLDFTNQVSEIGYDQLALTATRGPDGSIALSDIAMIAPDERLTGSGRITWAQGRPLHAQAFTVDLQLGVHGRIVDLVKTAGLLSSRRDDLNYAQLSQPIHFGGTLDHVDDTSWHDLLAKAATQKPPGAK